MIEEIKYDAKIGNVICHKDVSYKAIRATGGIDHGCTGCAFNDDRFDCDKSNCDQHSSIWVKDITDIIIKYEYCCILAKRLSYDDSMRTIHKNFLDRVNLKGLEGWELVQIVGEGIKMCAYLKRIMY